jgi:RNA recognition motif-containing protein
LVQRLSTYGEIATIKIVRDKKTHLSKGYAFVEVTNLADAEQIIGALDGTMIDGRELTINIVKEAPARSK